MRFLSAVLLTSLAVASGASSTAAQTVGFTTEPLVPVGKFAKAIDIGWGSNRLCWFPTRWPEEPLGS